MGRRDYRPWSHEEEANLERWVAQHLELTWSERAEQYSEEFGPRSSESLRSKLRQVKRNIRRRRALHMRHWQRRRGLMAKVVGRRQQAALAPARSGPCPRYATSGQIYAGLHERPSAGHPMSRKTLSVNEKAASSLLYKFYGVKKPDVQKRMDLTPRSQINAVPGKPAWSFQVSKKSPQPPSLLWHVVYSLAGRRRR